MSNAARSAMFQSFALPDEHSFGVFKALNEVYPAFAKKLFEGNQFMSRLIMYGYNPMDILDYPVCGKCESLAIFNGYATVGKKKYPRCTCVKPGCGANTNNPISLRTWIRDELKHKAPPEFFEAIETAIDGIAAKMILTHIRQMKKEMERHNTEILPKISNQEVSNATVMTQVQAQSEVTIEHMGTTDDPGLPEDRIEIGDELDEE